MTVRVLGLESGVTSLEDHRMLLQLFQQPEHSDGILHRRSGIVPSDGAADLTTASAMQADIAPFVAWIDGTSNALQGGYPFASDATETLTFSDGDATNDRIDLVVAQIRDNTYDASGETDGRVVIVEGTAASSPSVPATPDSSIALFQVLVEAGDSAGSGGIDFGANVTDVRTYIRRHRDTEVLESGTTWTNPQDGFKAVRVRVVGGAGQGGGSQATGAGEASAGEGGSAGNYSESLIPAADLGSTETVTVGSGGSGGGAGSSGGNGSSSSFGSHVIAPGGNGGGVLTASSNANFSSGTMAPAAGTGDVAIRGGAGGGAFRFGSGDTCQGGVGGDSPLGAGAQVGANGAAGINGTEYGGGGSGASSRNNDTGEAGGAGADGVVIIEYVY